MNIYYIHISGYISPHVCVSVCLCLPVGRGQNTKKIHEICFHFAANFAIESKRNKKRVHFSQI